MFGLPVYSKAMGASALGIGGLFSAFTATTLILRPAVGWLLDRFGRKRFFVAALGVYVLAMMAYIFATNLSGLYLARILQGVGSALLWISLNTIVADLTSAAERGRAMGRVNEVIMRGGILGAFPAFFLISVLPEATAWPIIFAGYTVLTLLSVLLAWRNVPETKGEPEPSEDLRPGQAMSRLFLALAVLVFVTGTSEAMLGPIYLIYIQDRFTVDVSILALAFLPVGLVYGLAGSRLGGLSDRLGRSRIIVIGLVGSALMSLLLPLAPALIWVVAVYTLSAVMWASSEPAEAALVAELVGQERRGLAYGLYSLAGDLGFTIGPLLGGWLYDTVAHETPFYLNGLILLVSALWVALTLGKVASSPVRAERPSARVGPDVN
jgi:MFS family permease